MATGIPFCHKVKCQRKSTFGSRAVALNFEQIGLTATVGQIMSMKTAHTDAPVLEDAFA